MKKSVRTKKKAIICVAPQRIIYYLATKVTTHSYHQDGRYAPLGACDA